MIIKRFLNYNVSERGEITNDKGMILKGLLKPDGYKMYYLCNKWYYIHRIVGWLFVPNPHNKPEINHLDRNKSNNHHSNLQWCTHKENIQHSYDTGRKRYKGLGHWNAGKTPTEATRKLMSEAKIGARHPKFKGYYIINGERFDSSNLAAKATGYNNRTIIRWCKAKKPKPNFSFQPI